MKYALEIDAADVLGTPHGATLQEIRDAYRVRVKKHHPDVGGDEWAFRAVSRAYEVLSNARLRSRVGAEWPWVETVHEHGSPAAHQPHRHDPDPARAEDRTPPPPPRSSHTPPPPDNESSWVHAGVEDRVDSPTKVVDIELFTIRFEINSPINLLGSPKDRNLSSCLNISWPAPPHHDGEPETPADPATLKLVTKAFEAMPRKTKAVASWSRSNDGRFVGWLSYPTANQAFEAFELFHRTLNDKGLGVRQSTRELFLSRETR
jgi:hypothetical protein